MKKVKFFISLMGGLCYRVNRYNYTQWRKDDLFNKWSYVSACVCAQLCLTLCDPMNYSPPDSSALGFPMQEHWSELPFPPPVDLLDPGIEPTSLAHLLHCRWILFFFFLNH